MTGDGISNRFLDELATRGRVGAQDVLHLRRAVFADGLVSREEARALLCVDRAATEKSPEWTAFLVEAVSDYLVHQERPAGHVSEDNAAWLVDVLADHDGDDLATKLEVLIGVLERATSTPASLSAHALAVVAQAVVEGDGRLSCGGEITPGVIGKPEVALMRRILYAFGGGEGIGISRAEAEVLFDLNDRTASAANDAEWSELFVKAIANFVMCASGYVPPCREEALRREAFLDSADVDVAGFFRRMASGGVKGIFAAYRRDFGRETGFAALNTARAQASAEAEAIDADEAAWLVDRITRDRAIHDNERALLTFIARESPSIHPAIRELAAKVA
jgi:hypothetical protein